MAVSDVAAELYSLPPDRFTAARDEAAKLATSAGDSTLAGAIRRLRRPTTSAWLVNRLAREQPGLVQKLLDIGDELRAALSSGDGDRMRELTQQRRTAVAELLRAIRALADAPISTAIDQEVAATLEAATADAETAEAVRAGCLAKPVRYAGFGFGEAPAVAQSPAPAKRAAASPTAKQPAERPPARAKQLDELRRAVRDASAAADDAQEDLAAADRAIERAREQAESAAAEEARLRQELSDAGKRRRAAERDVERAERARMEAYRAASTAHREAERLRERLGRLERS